MSTWLIPLVGVVFAIAPEYFADVGYRSKIQRVVQAQDLELRTLRQELAIDKLARV